MTDWEARARAAFSPPPTDTPWAKEIQAAQERVAALKARGYLAGGKGPSDHKTFVTCVRCGSAVARAPAWLDTHDAWHDKIEQLARLDRPEGTTERER